MDEISEELRKAEAKNAALNKDVKVKDKAVETAQNECKYLKAKLQELESALTESDQSTRQMEAKLKVFVKVIRYYKTTCLKIFTSGKIFTLT